LEMLPATPEETNELMRKYEQKQRIYHKTGSGR
jgi:hypothetical protein